MVLVLRAAFRKSRRIKLRKESKGKLYFTELQIEKKAKENKTLFY